MLITRHDADGSGGLNASELCAALAFCLESSLPPSAAAPPPSAAVMGGEEAGSGESELCGPLLLLAQTARLVTSSPTGSADDGSCNATLLNLLDGDADAEFGGADAEWLLLHRLPSRPPPSPPMSPPAGSSESGSGGGGDDNGRGDGGGDGGETFDGDEATALQTRQTSGGLIVGLAAAGVVLVVVVLLLVYVLVIRPRPKWQWDARTNPSNRFAVDTRNWQASSRIPARPVFDATADVPASMAGFGGFSSPRPGGLAPRLRGLAPRLRGLGEDSTQGRSGRFAIPSPRRTSGNAGSGSLSGGLSVSPRKACSRKGLPVPPSVDTRISLLTEAI